MTYIIPVNSCSICIATYNGQSYIDDQLRSVICQIGPQDEIIISDDGSTDSTIEIIKQHQDSRVKIKHQSRVGGVVNNFERCIESALGEIIILCDQDDVWLPGRVDLIRKSLERFDLIVLNGKVVDADLNPRGMTVFESVGTESGFMPNLIKNGFVGCCMAFRREVRDLVVPFPNDVPWHDWYIGLVAELLFKVERIDEPTLLYRRHGANFSPTGEKSKNSLWIKITMRWHVLRAVLVVCARKAMRSNRS